MSIELQNTLNKFVFLAIELSVLFLGISLLVGMLQRHISPEKIESLLSGGRGRGYFIAAALGAITPFCSCSTIPMLKGLLRARAGFGPTMVFLFTSPLLNPVVVVLLFATFGIKLTSIYAVAALVVSLAAGWLLQTLRFDRYVREESSGARSGCSATVSSSPDDLTTATRPHQTDTPEIIASSMAGAGLAATAKAVHQGRYHGLWQKPGKTLHSFCPICFLAYSWAASSMGSCP